ncbi:acetyltransferase [Hydrogenimonas sp.]
MDKTIAVYGASGHGKVVADIALRCGYERVLFIDDGKNDCMNFESYIKKYGTSSPVALGIGDNRVRESLYRKLKAYGCEVATLVHPDSTVSKSVLLQEGTVVMAGVIVNTDAAIGKGVILNSGCIVEHDCNIADFVHISPNVSLGGAVKVGRLSHLGIGCCSIQGIEIGEECIVGAGSVVIEPIKNGVTAVGNPARIIKDADE